MALPWEQDWSGDDTAGDDADGAVTPKPWEVNWTPQAAPTWGQATAGAVKAGLGDVMRSATQNAALARGEVPDQGAPDTGADATLNAPFDVGTMPDAATAKKVVYKAVRGLTGGAPEIAAGVAGGAAGAAVAPEAAPIAVPIGAGLAAGAVSAARTVAPYYAQAAAQSPDDLNGAFDRAVKQAATEGAITGTAFAAFGVAPFASSVKNLILQASVVQPSIAAGGQAVQNVEQGQPASQGVVQAAAEAVPATAIPMAAHAVMARAAPERPAVQPPVQDPTATPLTDEAVRQTMSDALDRRLAEMEGEASGANAPPPAPEPSAPLYVAPTGEAMTAEQVNDAGTRAGMAQYTGADAQAQADASAQAQWEGEAPVAHPSVEGQGAPLYVAPTGEAMTAADMAATPPGAITDAVMRAQGLTGQPASPGAPAPDPVAQKALQVVSAQPPGTTMTFAAFHRAMGIPGRAPVRAVLADLETNGLITRDNGKITIQGPKIADAASTPAVGDVGQPPAAGPAAPPPPAPSPVAAVEATHAIDPDALARAPDTVSTLRDQGWTDNEIGQYGRDLAGGYNPVMNTDATPADRTDGRAIVAHLEGAPAEPAPTPAVAAPTSVRAYVEGDGRLDPASIVKATGLPMDKVQSDLQGLVQQGTIYQRQPSAQHIKNVAELSDKSAKLATLTNAGQKVPQALSKRVAYLTKATARITNASQYLRTPKRGPRSLLQWMAQYKEGGRQGMADVDGEIARRDLLDHFEPGYGKPFKKDATQGLDPDKIAAAAVARGYLPEGGGEPELYKAIDKEVAGKKVHAADTAEDAANREAQARYEADAARMRDEVDALRQEASGSGHKLDLTDDEMSEAALLARRGRLTPIQAVDEVVTRRERADQAVPVQPWHDERGVDRNGPAAGQVEALQAEARNMGYEPELNPDEIGVASALMRQRGMTAMQALDEVVSKRERASASEPGDVPFTAKEETPDGLDPFAANRGSVPAGEAIQPGGTGRAVDEGREVGAPGAEGGHAQAGEQPDGGQRAVGEKNQQRASGGAGERIAGSGPGGRILPADRRAAAAERAERGAAAGAGQFELRATEPGRPEPTAGRGADLVGGREQFVLPGAERSGRQLAEGREATGKGRIKPTAEQREADQGLFKPKDDTGEMFSAKASASSADRADLETTIKGAIDRITGGRAKVEFHDTIERSGEGIERSGGSGTHMQTVAGTYSPLERLIRVAMSNRFGALKTGLHEAWHDLQRWGVFTPDEKRALDISTDRMKAMARADGLNADAMSRDELEAVAFAHWQDKTESGERMPGLLPGVLRAFRKASEIFTHVRQALTGKGWTTAEDVFGRGARGEIAERGSRAEIADVREEIPGKEQYSVGTLAKQAAPIYAKDETQDIRSKAVRDVSARIRDQANIKVPTWEKVRNAISYYRENGKAIVLQGIADHYYAIAQMEKRMNAGKLLDASKSAYKAVRMTQNLNTVMSFLLNHGPIELRDGSFVPRAGAGFDGGFQGIFTKTLKNGEMELFKDWIVAQRANRLLGEGREHLMDAGDIKTVNDAVGADPDRAQRFAKAFSDYQRFNDHMLDMAVSSGRVSRAQAEMWSSSGDYVPFYRLMEDSEQPEGPKRSRGLSQPGPLSKQLKGGAQRLGDPIENMVMNMAKMVDSSFKNEALRRMVDMGLDDGSISPKAPSVDANYTQQKIGEMLTKYGIDFSKLSAPEQAKWTTMLDSMIHPPGDAVTVWRDGKPVQYDVYDPMLLKSVSALTPNQLGGVMKVMRMARHVLSQGVTIQPAYMVANNIRDTLTTWAVSGHKGFNPIKDAPRNILKAWKSDPSLLAMEAAGSGMGTFYDTTPATVRKMIDKRLMSLGDDKNRVIDNISKAWQFYNKVGAVAEQANRIALYDHIVKNGGSPAEAAYQSLDLLDFNLKGDWAAARFLTESVPFLNARLQGLYRLGRGAIGDDPAQRYMGLNKQFIRTGGLIMAATLALAAANSGNPDYEALKDWDKDSYWHVWVDGQHWRIPKPFEVGALFATVPERLVRLLNGSDDTATFGQSMANMFQSTLAMDVRPQLFKPIMEAWANRDSFRGSVIVPEGMKNFEPEAQYTAQTSEAARILGRVMPDSVGALGKNLVGVDVRSPLVIDYLVRGYLGGLGEYLTDGADALASAATELPPQPAVHPEDNALILRFFEGDRPRTEKYVDDLEDLHQQVQGVAGTLNHYQSTHDLAAAKDFLGEPETREKMAEKPAIDAAYTAMTKINRQMQQVRDSATLDPERKRDLLDRLTVQRNQVAKQAMAVAPAIHQIIAGLAGNQSATRRLAAYAGTP